MDICNFYTQRWDRRTAVNITEKTVEIRIYRGNLRECRLRKNIEATIAVLEFARETAAVGYLQPSDDQFIHYVRCHASRFQNLLEYINILERSTPSATFNAVTSEEVNNNIEGMGQ